MKLMLYGFSGSARELGGRIVGKFTYGFASKVVAARLCRLLFEAKPTFGVWCGFVDRLISIRLLSN